VGETEVKTAPARETLSHNLLGQRLGRKGRDTRERILAATEHLLSSPSDTPISLSAVAREASLGMTTLYLYFNDLTELILAVLDAVMASAEHIYVAHLRGPWADAELADHCLRFVEDYYAFWERNSRVLHLRNSLVDAGEQRVREHRIAVFMPVIELLVRQMDGDPGDRLAPAFSMATALLTGIERVVTVATDVSQSREMTDGQQQIRGLLKAEARLLELGVRDCRQASR
jgi:AcrR family transcriptional regulator